MTFKENKDSMKCVQFVGPSVGTHGQYSFFKAFRFCQPEQLADEILTGKKSKSRVIRVGQFFFVRIAPDDDPCIGELQLLWYDTQSNQSMSSIRLYFLPEQTPDGRRQHHGEHEVLAASEKVVLRLEDLGQWITDQVDWTHGLFAPSCPRSSPKQSSKSYQPVLPIKSEVENGVVPLEVTKVKTEPKIPVLAEDLVEEESQDVEDNREPSVVVLSYPHYCRYRAVLLRLGHLKEVWLRDSLVAALGGFSAPTSNSRALFCRDTFEHEGLMQNDLNCEHLTPDLKNKAKKKKVKANCVPPRSHSPGSESNASEECKENVIAKVSAETILVSSAPTEKKKACKDEQEFLQKVFKFMQDRNTPINRVPHLGFKQIDLYFFYMYAQRLGGYAKVTSKKMWKHVYDEMGGNPGSTSAATCTRRHYERLLLPFENHMNGEDHKNMNLPKGSYLKDEPLSGDERGDDFNVDGIQFDLPEDRCSDSPPPSIDGSACQDDLEMVVEDGDELVIDLREEEEPVKGEAIQVPDEDSDSEVNVPLAQLTKLNNIDQQHHREPITPIETKPVATVAAIPTIPLDSKEIDSQNNADALAKIILLQKKQRVRDNTFSEKERRWNEIRKKNAIARTWVRKGSGFPLHSHHHRRSASDPDCAACKKESIDSAVQRIYQHSGSVHPPSQNNNHSSHRHNHNSHHTNHRVAPYYSSNRSSEHHRNQHNNHHQHNHSKTSENGHSYPKAYPPTHQDNMLRYPHYERASPISSAVAIKQEHLLQPIREPSLSPCLARPSVIQHTEEISSPPPASALPLPAHMASSKPSRSGHHHHPFQNSSSYKSSRSSGFEFHHHQQSQNGRSTKNALKAPDIYAKNDTPTPTVSRSRYYYNQQQRQISDSTAKAKKYDPLPPSVNRRFSASTTSSRAIAAVHPTLSVAPAAPSTYYQRGASWSSDEVIECETAVLDLSMKKKSDMVVAAVQKHTAPITIIEGECLDLSIKKPKIASPPRQIMAPLVDLTDEARGIENVTPPSPVRKTFSTAVVAPLKTTPPIGLLRGQPDKHHSPILVPFAETKSPYALDIDVLQPQGKLSGAYRSEFSPRILVNNGPVSGQPYLPTATSPSWPMSGSNPSHSQRGHYSSHHLVGQSRSEESEVAGLPTSLAAYSEMVERGILNGQIPYTLANHLYPFLYKDNHAYPRYGK